MAEWFTPAIVHAAVLGAGVLGLAALAAFGERRFSIANLLLVLGFLGLVAGGLTGVPGSPVPGAEWGLPAGVGGALLALVGAVLCMASAGRVSRTLMLTRSDLEAKKREVQRLGGVNARMEDEVQELRGRLTRAELERERQKQTGDSARQQRATLAKLSAREKRHREVFEHAWAGMATLEKETLRMAEVNENLANVSGYSKDQLTRMTLIELFMPGESQPGRADLQRAARDARPLNIELRHSDGHPVPAEVSISVIGDGAGRQLLAIVRDVTEQRALEIEARHRLEQLQERERSLKLANEDLAQHAAQIEEMNQRMQEMQEVKDHFLSSVSHELRTPLTSIRSFSEILLKHGEAEPEIRLEFLTIINKESERLTRLVNNVLDLAKIESGQAQLELSDFDVREVLQDAIASMSGLAASSGVHITRLWGEDPRPLFADRDKVQQLVMNLLANAVKFSPEGGRVDVLVRDGSGPGRVEIAVKDRGPGIPAEDLDRIFEKYHQVGDASGGTGLGLTICHEIVLLHDGQIWAESQPDKGSLFRVDLPGAQESRARYVGIDDSYGVPMLSPVSESIDAMAEPYGYESRPAAFHVAHDQDRPASRPVSVEAISDMISEDPKMSETGTLPPLGDWWKLGNE